MLSKVKRPFQVGEEVEPIMAMDWSVGIITEIRGDLLVLDNDRFMPKDHVKRLMGSKINQRIAKCLSPVK